MSNQSLFNASVFSTADTTPSLDHLLDTFGFDAWKTIIASFILPMTSLVGLALCLLSVWIFSHEKFKDPVFFYYRLLCIIYIIHLMHNIPRGIFFSPRYLQNINTYISSIYLIYSACFTSFLFHYEETLQMAILLTRMRLFSPFVKKHFTSKPWLISLSFFLACLLINIPFIFALKVESFGSYSYEEDSSKVSKRIAYFYYFKSSDFSMSPTGRLLLGFTGPFLKTIVLVIVDVALNVVSVSLYRTYIRERREKENALNESQPTTSSKVVRTKEFTRKEINENKAERNMFFMALTLCSISIVSRLFFVFSFVYIFYFNSFSDILFLNIINLAIYTLVPTMAIGVFYFFNKLFRQVIREKIKNLKCAA
jgi:hypothetical protein